jgi:hypothetical protein
MRTLTAFMLSTHPSTITTHQPDPEEARHQSNSNQSPGPYNHVQSTPMKHVRNIFRSIAN